MKKLHSMISIIVCLNKHTANGQPLRVSDMSKHIGLSISCIEGYLQPLKAAGIVDSSRGPNGGYWLPRNDLTVTELFLAINEKQDALTPIYDALSQVNLSAFSEAVYG